MSAVGDLLANVEQRRQDVSAELSAKHRASLGQFFTPTAAAGFLAGLIELPERGTFRLLDPGAGVGSLSAAVVARVVAERPGVRLQITAFEVDEPLIRHLTASLEECVEVAASHGASVTFEVRHASFVEYATGWLFEQPQQFDAVIANPPYRKVNTSAPERIAAESRGLRASNLYTIFAGLSADLLTEGGQLSIIVPRSWANGPYHEPFRRYLFARCSLDLLHVYETRGKVFADSEVLQENVVMRAVRGRQVDTVTLSTSAGGDDPGVERRVPVEEVLRPDDPHLFVRIPLDARATRVAEQIAALPATLAVLDIQVSTGRVVDFRARPSLRDEPSDDTVPLIYPGHLRNGKVLWPTPGSRKPNALHRSQETEALLLPNEIYVVVKRFSAKEERRRVVAAITDPEDLPGDAVAFENHLNVFHRANRGLPVLLALGLSAYLNCTLVDDYVRSFSGHTQINATDLRQLGYPRPSDMVRLGAILSAQSWPAQAELDALVAEYVPAVSESVVELEAA
ncbi:MAG: Eco57I restriction-modification methylase domain-containing protein [Actinomycetota bacterium]|nr:Eco57I restriction-modification methylase domain-containing protein [Actinomycetota bacterium]